MHVPLVLVGPGVAAGTTDTPVSIRRIFFTVLDWAGLGAAHSLRADDPDPVLAEAMKPFLEFGWQPQRMIVGAAEGDPGRQGQEVYDLAADPGETHDLNATRQPAGQGADGIVGLPGAVAAAARAARRSSAADRQKLASLGYVSGGATPVVRKDAPRPADMTSCSSRSARRTACSSPGRYAKAAPLLARS